MFILITAAFLLVTFRLVTYFSVKHPLTITLIIGLVISSISSISLWLNYKASTGEQDGISISNLISYWIITDSVRWTQELFMDYFIYAMVVTIFTALLIAFTFYFNKQTRIVS
ncbi:hypothetical protein AAV98_15805 [Bacillus sp. CHD6a]|nr:hypothetical protein AAV98_15805 [Bacillus sp. CHD6a]